ncbi:MAG: AMP-binding protein [Bacteroidota bacterium]
MIHIVQQSEIHQKRLAIIANGKEYTYSDLLEVSKSAGSSLLENKDDLQEARVAFLVDPGFSYTAIQWGIWQAGGIAVPLCNMHPLPSIQYVLEDSQVSTLIVGPAYEEFLQPLAKEKGIRLLKSEQILEAPKRSLPDVAPERRAMILYTSGTTSQPKGVVTTHLNIEAQIKTLVKAWSWRKSDHILCVLPLHHVHGIINVMSCALWSGACCEFLPKFDAKKVFNIFLKGRVNLFMAVPTIYFKLIQYWETLPSVDKSAVYPALSKFRLMVSGSAALPVSVMKKWQQLSGQVLLERYGMTEIGMALSNSYKGERRPGHVGKALPGVKVRLVDERGKKVVRGEQGEIQVKGDSVFLEYWQKPEATQEAFTEDGWFQTGDMAVFNEGSYKILGRTSVDIIKSGGYKISALEIEEVLRTHPQIKDCGVVGISNNEWGELVACGLVPEEEAPDEYDLNFWLRDFLPTYKIPRRYIILKELPRNTLGKVTKNELKKLFCILWLCLVSLACQNSASTKSTEEVSEAKEQITNTTKVVETTDQNSTPVPSNLLQGEYVYYADAGIFFNCQDGQKYDVAAEGDNTQLEKGYLAKKQQDMERIYVELQGTLSPRSKMEGKGKKPSIIVEKVLGFDRSKKCQK